MVLDTIGCDSMSWRIALSYWAKSRNHRTTRGTIMRMSRRHLATSMLTAIGGGALARVARAQPTANPPAYLQQLYAQAKAAGQTQVIVYAASSADNVPLYQEFQKQFSTITVKGIDLFGPPLEAR